jgi:hypothetical protein
VLTNRISIVYGQWTHNFLFIWMTTYCFDCSDYSAVYLCVNVSATDIGDRGMEVKMGKNNVVSNVIFEGTSIWKTWKIIWNNRKILQNRLARALRHRKVCNWRWRRATHVWYVGQHASVATRHNRTTPLTIWCSNVCRTAGGLRVVDFCACHTSS